MSVNLEELRGVLALQLFATVVRTVGTRFKNSSSAWTWRLSGHSPERHKKEMEKPRKNRGKTNTTTARSKCSGCFGWKLVWCWKLHAHLGTAGADLKLSQNCRCSESGSHKMAWELLGIPDRSGRVHAEIYISCASGPDHKVICLIPLVRSTTCPALKNRTAANARGWGFSSQPVSGGSPYTSHPHRPLTMDRAWSRSGHGAHWKFVPIRGALFLVYRLRGA